MSQLPNIQDVATTTTLQTAGNANSNGTVIDLQGYKGPVTFVLGVGQTTSGLGAAHLNVANIETSNDNGSADAFAVPTGGAFSAVVNTANASNVGTQVKSFDVRNLERYARVRTEVSGTNVNVPLVIAVIGQKERV
jgi:hypothetical protein